VPTGLQRTPATTPNGNCDTHGNPSSDTRDAGATVGGQSIGNACATPQPTAGHCPPLPERGSAVSVGAATEYRPYP
jgi:hypothetical protein